MLAIEGFFEEHGDQVVRQLWSSLAEQDVSTFMVDKPYIPHITFGGVLDDKFADMKTQLTSFAKQFSPVPVNMPHFGVFTSPFQVLFLGVTVTDTLHDLHRQFYKQCSDNLDMTLLYVPEFWIPHCTLAFQLDDSTMLKALNTCRSQPLPVNTLINRLAIVESTTGEVLYSVVLESSQS